MSSAVLAPPENKTLADLIEQLGGIPLERIPLHVPIGQATEADVLFRPRGEKRLYELVDGVLVEKPMGYYESIVAGILIQGLWNFLDRHDLGIVLGADGTLRLAPGLVRVPDVSFIRWERFPNRKLPKEPIPDLGPDLAIEVLSPTNTKAEMRRKVREYFASGAQLAWLIDPATRTARVYTSPTEFSDVAADGELDGGELLPGFRVSLADLFRRAGDR